MCPQVATLKGILRWVARVGRTEGRDDLFGPVQSFLETSGASASAKQCTPPAHRISTSRHTGQVVKLADEPMLC